MAALNVSPRAISDSPALERIRQRGQFLVAGLLWAAAAALLIVASAYFVFVYHYAIGLFERVRASLGIPVPPHGPDWAMLAALSCGPLLVFMCLLALFTWYQRVWRRRLQRTWHNEKSWKRHARWERLPVIAGDSHRGRKAEYFSALQRSAPLLSQKSTGEEAYEAMAERALLSIEKDVAERALTVGLTVGISRSRSLDLFTIVVGAFELQLHVLSSLGKRPSWRAWRMMIQRCGASLFINTYLNRQDALALNLLIKKAGMGMYAAGDLMEHAAAHLSDSDFDLDEALNLQHSGIVGMATKGLELGATMALTVGQVGMHVLGSLIESVGDELAQGALAAGILYFHGMALAADALALDEAHRQSPAMSRNFRDGVWKMGEIAGTILRDIIRQRRVAFRDKRRRIVKSLPKSAYAGIQALFGRKAASAGEPG